MTIMTMTEEQKTFLQRHKNFIILSIVWYLICSILLISLFITSNPLFVNIKLFVIENYFTIILTVLAIPPIMRAYYIYSELAYRKFRIAEMDIKEKELYIDCLRQQTELKSNVDFLAKSAALEISNYLAENLSKDSKWAATALREAAILGGSLSIFGQRVHHFRHEKEILAENFFNSFLAQRIDWILKKKNEINNLLVILDSGTTILPFFELFSKEALNKITTKENDNWSKVVIVTNNIPGISDLIKHGRLNPNDRYSEIAINCKILPGHPLAVYSAIVGPETVEAIKNIRKDKDYVIGLTTGNFIGLSETRINPFARGEGHHEFKKELSNICDEVYIIASLGKMIRCKNVNDFNDDLGFKESNQSQEGKPYKEIITIINKTRLITTRRESKNALLNTFSESVYSLLHINEPHHVIRSGEMNNYIEKSINEIPHIMLDFDDLPQSKFDQEMIELPHAYMRTHKIKDKYFGIK